MIQPDSASIHVTLGESVIEGGACAAPGTRQRIVQIRTLREAGYSLDEIAARFGITRERVRQILRAHGAPDSELVAEARRQRAALLAESRVDELLALWRAGHEPGSAASALGLQTAACKSTIARFATDVDKAARRASMSGARGGQTYSDREIIFALRAVGAALARVPSAKEYALLARGLELPSLPTVLSRMGGWSRAVEAAGMTPVASSSAAARQRRWTDGACWAALRRVVDELGEVPTVVSYERHAAGREDLPSAATVRNRLGRWSAITAQLAVERELAAHVQVTAYAPGQPSYPSAPPSPSPSPTPTSPAAAALLARS
ncbi:MAG TPA: sigma factor-like helix-turn-helix DNA-binding protein [Solirubrobacteraceae bacterium]|jgi:transposase|nr:sigma factor-like helix-turn-helix DNA-binding protein [Solirubrobacteraceae bacterium]